MGRAAAARRLAAAAAYGGGGLSVLGASLYGVLRAEATLARKAIGTTDGRVPDATGWYGRGRPGPAIKIALLGDSSAAGLRRPQRRGDPRRLARARAWPSAPTGGCTCASSPSSAPSPATSRAQVDKALLPDPDVAVILIGANDVTHTVLPSASVRHLSEAVRRLREADVEVVVGTCPDLGTISPHPHAAAPGRPGLVPPARRRADDRGRRGRRPNGVARLDPRPRVRGGAGPALRARPVPPLGRGLRGARPVLVPSVLSALGKGEAEEELPASAAARRCCRSATPRSRPARTPAPRSTAPRSAAPSAASAALGHADAPPAAAHRRRRDPARHRSRPRTAETPRPRSRPRRPRRRCSRVSRPAGSRGSAGARCRSRRS